MVVYGIADRDSIGEEERFHEKKDNHNYEHAGGLCCIVWYACGHVDKQNDIYSNITLPSPLFSCGYDEGNGVGIRGRQKHAIAGRVRL